MSDDKAFDVNVEWTLKSMKKAINEGKSRLDVCYSCAKENIPIKTYLVAVVNNRLQWTSASGPVYEKIKVQYCEACAEEMIKSLEEPEVASE
jgi:protein-arginine kinase activator protein McsA